jgi:hypothetical protein
MHRFHRFVHPSAALSLLLAVAGCAAPTDGGRAPLTDAPGGGGSTCLGDKTNLIAGQHHDAGTVSLTNDDANVYVEIETEDGWTVGAYHVYVGFGPVPTNRAGAPVPGAFPYAGTLPEGTTSATVTIPLADFEGACGDELLVAVHAEVSRTVDGITQSETAWGDGPFGFKRQWATYGSYGLCCDTSESCVLPKFIWRDHADWWSLSSLDMGGRTYDETEMKTILWTPAWGDASIEVAHQVIGAHLNVANGASLDPAESADLAAAEAWLAANADADGTLPYGVYSVSPAHAEGHALAESLRLYNEGGGSEPLCVWW